MLILNSRNRMHGLLGHARMALVFGVGVFMAMFLMPGPVCGEDSEVDFPERMDALVEDQLRGMAPELVEAMKSLFAKPWESVETEKLHESFKLAYYIYVSEAVSRIRASIENGSSVSGYVNMTKTFRKDHLRGAQNVPLETPVTEMIDELNIHADRFISLLATEIRNRYAKEEGISVSARACSRLKETVLPETVIEYFEKVRGQSDLESEMFSLMLESVIREEERKSRSRLKIAPGTEQHMMNNIIAFYANDCANRSTREEVLSLFNEFDKENPDAFHSISLWELDVMWIFNQVTTAWISDTAKESSSRFRMKQGDSTCTTFVYKKPEREREEEAD